MIDDILTRERDIEAEASQRADDIRKRNQDIDDFKKWCDENGKKPSLGAAVAQYIRKEVKA